MHAMATENLEERIAALKILIVDDDPFMHRVIRAMPSAVGVKRIQDACNGADGLDAIRTAAPDIVILD